MAAHSISCDSAWGAAVLLSGGILRQLKLPLSCTHSRTCEPLPGPLPLARRQTPTPDGSHAFCSRTSSLQDCAMLARRVLGRAVVFADAVVVIRLLAPAQTEAAQPP